MPVVAANDDYAALRSKFELKLTVQLTRRGRASQSPTAPRLASVPRVRRCKRHFLAPVHPGSGTRQSNDTPPSRRNASLIKSGPRLTSHSSSRPSRFLPLNLRFACTPLLQPTSSPTNPTSPAPQRVPPSPPGRATRETVRSSSFTSARARPLEARVVPRKAREVQKAIKHPCNSDGPAWCRRRQIASALRTMLLVPHCGIRVIVTVQPWRFTVVLVGDMMCATFRWSA